MIPSPGSDPGRAMGVTLFSIQAASIFKLLRVIMEGMRNSNLKQCPWSLENLSFIWLREESSKGMAIALV
jgi:hypothetical protein